MLLPLYYLRWHYSHAVVDLLHIVGNFLWFFNEFFSIKLLAATLFTPFHRLEDDRKKAGGLDFATMAEHILVGTIMRVVGALLRSVLIVFGIFFIVLTFILGIFFIVVWLTAPLLLTGLVISGLTLIAV